MSIFLLVETICASLAFALSILAISILALRRDSNGIYKPLILFFSVNVFIEFSSILGPFPKFGHLQNFHQVAEILSISGFLLLAPAFWFYVRGLTSESPTHLSIKDFKHFVPFLFGALTCALLLFSPENIRNQLIGDGNDPNTLWIITLKLMIIFTMVIWAVQVIGYIVALLRRLSTYRRRLKDMFASTEGRELRWIIWMIALLLINIPLIFYELFVDLPGAISFIPPAFNVVLIWFLAVWGLRQMPGFVLAGELELAPDANRDILSDITVSIPRKYEKSALTTKDMARITKKIETAMSEDNLYLEPNLSLRALSKHISVQSNYVSQTLNGHIGESFFDYVNRHRIDHAKLLLLDGQDSILNIAYDAGFNSRSSFYKSFKRETGQTPANYRAHPPLNRRL